MLSLCADCPELKSVDFQFEEVTDNEQELIQNAEIEFRRKFGPLQKLILMLLKV